MNQVKLNQQQAATQTCGHAGQARTVNYAKRECPECVAQGAKWVHLRICMTCGHVGCCDSSKNKHARAHFEKTGHPIIKSIEPDEDWAWCYLDDGYLD